MIRRTAQALLLLHISGVLSLPQGYPSYDDSDLSSYPLDPEQNPELYDSSEDVHDSFELGWMGDGFSVPEESSDVVSDYAPSDSSTPEADSDIVPDYLTSDSSATDEASSPVPVFSPDSYEGLKDFMDSYFALAEIYQGLDEEGKSEFTKKLEDTGVDSFYVDSTVHDKRQAPDPLDKQIETTPLTTTSSWDKVFSKLNPEKAAQLRRFLRLFKKYGGKAPGPEDGMASYVDYMTRWQDQLSNFDEGTQGTIVDLLAAGGPLPSDAVLGVRPSPPRAPFPSGAALGVRPSPPRAPLPSGLRPKSKGKGKDKGKVSKLYRLLQLWQSLNEEAKAAILASIGPSRLARRQTDDLNLLEVEVGAPAESPGADAPIDQNPPTEPVDESPATADPSVVERPPEDPSLDPALGPDPIDDAPADPTLVDPTPIDPGIDDPVLVDPQLVDPTPLDPAPVDPAADDEPVIVNPVPVGPLVIEPTSETPVVGVPAVETPTDVTPTEETPAIVVHAEDTPVVEAPADETPVTEPAVESPVVDVLAGETSVIEPAAETSAVLPSVDETPSVEPIVQETPVVETPVEDTPTVLLPTGEASVSETAEDTPTVLLPTGGTSATETVVDIPTVLPATDGTIVPATVVEETPTPVVEPLLDETATTESTPEETSVVEPAVEPLIAETSTPVLVIPVEETPGLEESSIPSTPAEGSPAAEPTTPAEEPPVVEPTLEPTPAEESPIVETPVDQTSTPAEIVTPVEVATPVVIPAVSETPISTHLPPQTPTPTTTEPAISAGTPPAIIKPTVAGRPRGQLRPTPIPGLPAFVNTWPDWALPLAYDWPEWAQRFGAWPDWMPWEYPRGGPGWRRLKAGLENWLSAGGETKKHRKRCGELAGKLSMRFLCDEE